MLRSVAAAEPAVTVTETSGAVSMVVALIAMAISAAEPVRVFTAVALIATVVLPSSVFNAAAATDASVTVMV